MGNYSFESVQLLRDFVKRRKRDLRVMKKPDPVTIYPIHLRFDSHPDAAKRKLLSKMGTSFHLPADDIKLLIEAGHDLLKGSKVFGTFVENAKKDLQRGAR
jgi:hypothetical protein